MNLYVIMYIRSIIGNQLCSIKGGFNIPYNHDKLTYECLKCEFEDKLSRELTTTEKDFLKWLADKQVS